MGGVVLLLMYGAHWSLLEVFSEVRQCLQNVNSPNKNVWLLCNI